MRDRYDGNSAFWSGSLARLDEAHEATPSEDRGEARTPKRRSRRPSEPDQKALFPS